MLPECDPCRLHHRLQLVALLFCALFASTRLHAQEPSRSLDELRKETVFDKDRLFLQVTDQSALSLGTVGRGDHDAFCELARHVHRFRNEELLSVARQDIAYDDLLVKNDAIREDLRYTLLRFEGRLKRLKRIGTFEELRPAGVAELYEAWVFPKGEDKPVGLMLTGLPEDLEPNVDYTPARPVTVAGYFFKLVEYETDQPSPKNPGRTLVRRAPLLVGRSLQLNPVGTRSTSETLPALLPIVIVSAALLLFIILGLTYLLRRSDRGLRHYTRQQQVNPFDNRQELPDSPLRPMSEEQQP